MTFHIGIPQLIYCLITLFGLIIAAVRHGEEITYNFGITIVGTLITFGLLYWGGFFG